MIQALILIVLMLSTLTVCALSVWGIFLIITSRGFSTAPTVSSVGPGRDVLVADIAERLKNAPDQQTVMDLGSGYGTLLLPLARQFPNHRFVGYEWGWTGYLVSRVRGAGLRNLTFYRRDLFTADISNADVIILFLMRFLMPRLKQKCHAEAKKTAVIYARRFKFPDIRPTREITLPDKDTIYIYNRV